MGATEVAGLSIRISQDGADQAATSLAKLSQAGGTLEQQMARVHTSLDAVDSMYGIFGNATEANAQKQQILKSQIQNLISQGYDKLTPEVQRLKMAYDALEPAQSKQTSGFASVAMQIAGLSTGYGLIVQAGQKVLSVIKDTTKESITLAAEFEKDRMTWGVLTGDMDKGSQIFDKLFAFAAKTPLSFQGVNQAATTLKGFGVATQDLIPVMSKLGDIAMGDNEKLQRIALAYGQVMAQGKAKAQDLYQFINAGVPILNLLAESTGGAIKSAKDLGQDGGVSFEQIKAAIDKATDSGGQFFNMMDKTAETTSGKWSTAMDNFKIILSDIGNIFLPAVNAGLDAFNNGAQSAIDLGQEKKNISVMSSYQPWVEKNLPEAEQDKDIIAYHDAIQSEIDIENRRLQMYKYSDAEREEHLRIIQSYYRKLDEISRDYGAANGRVNPSTLTNDMPLAPWQTMLQTATKDSENKEGFSSFDTYIKAVTDKANTLSEIYRSLGMNSTKPFVDAQNEVRKTLEKLIDLGYTGPIGLAKLKEALEDLEGKQYPGNKGWGDVKKTPWGPATTGPLFAGSSDNASWSDVTRTPWGPATDTPISPEVASYNRTASTMDGLRQQLADLANGEEEYGIAAKKAEGWTNEEIEAFKKLKDALTVAQALNQLKKGLEGIAETAAVDTFQSIGKALASGSSFGDSFAASMSKIGAECTAQIGSLATVTGLKMLFENPANIVGWELLAAGGIVSIFGGAWGASNSSSSASSNTNELNTALAQYYLNAEAFNSSGRVAASLTGYAHGGIPELPGFSAYRNMVVDRPHFFGFASGGVFGEAGPEAAVPLVRTRSGNLGVETAGSGGRTVVNVHNYVGQADVTQSESVDASGLRTVDVYLNRKVDSRIAKNRATAGRRISG